MPSNDPEVLTRPNSQDYPNRPALDPGHTHDGASLVNVLGYPAGLTGATAATRYVGGTASGHPVSGAFLKGDFVIDQTGAEWVCTVAGSPGTWVELGSGGGGSGTVSDVTSTGSTLTVTNPTGPTVNVEVAAGQFKTIPVAADPVQSRSLALMEQFNRWLQRRPGARGFIGEMGWPSANGGSADHLTWAKVGETLSRAADADDLWMTYYGCASYVGSSGAFAVYYATVAGQALNAADASTGPIAAAHETYGRVLRGVNVGGLEVLQAGFNNTSLGTHGTDFFSEPTGSFAYLYSQGVRLVRIAFRWERVQPTLNSALDTTEWGYVTALVTAARAAGLYVVLDLHNYGAYITTGGAQALCTATAYAPSTVSGSNFADLWTRISAVYASDPGVFYGLMNEPSGILAGSGVFTTTDVVSTFEDNTVDGWTDGFPGHLTLSASTTRSHGGTHSLAVAFDGATQYPFIVNTTPVNPDGERFGAWVWFPSALAGGFLNLALTFGNGATVSGEAYFPTSNTWNLIECDIPETLRGVQVTQMNVDFNAMPAASATIYVDDIGFGAGQRTGTSAAAWEQIAQQAVDAIRNNGDSSLILVSLADRAEPDHPYGPWIEDRGFNDATLWDNIRYERHIYFDVDQSGRYLNSYATEITDAEASGFGTPY